MFVNGNRNLGACHRYELTSYLVIRKYPHPISADWGGGISPVRATPKDKRHATKHSKVSLSDHRRAAGGGSAASAGAVVARLCRLPSARRRRDRALPHGAVPLRGVLPRRRFHRFEVARGGAAMA